MRLNMTIDRTLKDKTPDFCIGVLVFKASVMIDDQLTNLIHQKEQEVQTQYTLKSLLKTPNILVARNAYKAYGKDPSRYRLAVESLFRRIIKGNTLYRINNLVDLGNYLSLHFQKSTAVLDLDKIQGDIFIRLGKDEPYEGIARGDINIKDIPVYVDEVGPFGSTTSDTPRTMITNESSNILLLIISFTGKDGLDDELAFAKQMVEAYAKATVTSSFVVS